MRTFAAAPFKPCSILVDLKSRPSCLFCSDFRVVKLSRLMGNRPEHRQTGFTLVELMVVLAVLALAATVVMLSLPGSEARAASEADRLAARIAAVRDLAIVEGRPVAVVISPSGYAFERRSAAGWESISGRGFERRDWPDDVRIVLPANQPAIRIGFDPIGMTAGRSALSLAAGDSSARIVVTTTGEVLRDE